MSQRNGGISISFTTQSSPQRLSEIVRDVTESVAKRFLSVSCTVHTVAVETVVSETSLFPSSNEFNIIAGDT